MGLTASYHQSSCSTHSKRRRSRRLYVEALEGRETPSAGALDPSLAGTGVVSINSGSALAVQTDGKIVLASGYRFNADGTLDTTFGNNGEASIGFEATGIAIQSNGKIVFAGTASQDFALTRLNADGSLDTSFGTNGMVLTNFSETTQVTISGLRTILSRDSGEAVAIQVVNGAEKIIVMGSTQDSGDSDFAFARYDLDGTLDPVFGIDGKVTTDFKVNSSDYGSDLVIQPDGKIVAVGSAYRSVDDLSNDFAIARYDVNGLLDPTFGAGGIVTTNFRIEPAAVLSTWASSGSHDRANAVALQNDGNIVVAGTSYGDSASDIGWNFALARYNPNGTLDPLFGDPVADGPARSGLTTTDFGSSESANDIVIQSDGKIILVGSNEYGDFRTALARYTVEAELDSSFGIGGLVRSYDSLAGGRAAALENFSGDEKLLVAGGGLARFHTTGGSPHRLSVSTNTTQITEGNSGTQDVTITVTLSAPHDQPVTVNYDTPLDGRTTNKDFSVLSGMLTFEPGETTKAVTVTVNGDTTYEWDEWLVLRLANATNALIEDSNAGVEIVNDDRAPLVVSDVSQKEGDDSVSYFVFTVTLTEPTERYVPLWFQTVDATATAGSDYTLKEGAYQFGSQPGSFSVAVPIWGDTTEEENETFNLRLNYNGDMQNQLAAEAVGTILNDDGPPPRISITDVRKKEGLSGTTAFIFTVNLSHAASAQVTANYSTADGTAKASQDYAAISGTLTFAPGETTKTVTIWVYGDRVKEADETFFLDLSAPTNATLEDGQGLGTILNDDR